ncbi:MAG: DUF4823 domain-containing protein [bacterium]|nr:DUF4823 domain-containing protein [bacterium]
MKGAILSLRDESAAFFSSFLHSNVATLSGALPMLVVVSSLAACIPLTHRYEFRSNVAAGPQGFPRSGSFYVALAEDGFHGNRKYAGSGTTMTLALTRHLSTFASEAEAAIEKATVDEARWTANEHGHRYLVWPEILNWEDRASQWGFRSDRVSVRVVLIEVSSDRVYSDEVLSVTQGVFTTSPLGEHLKTGHT